MHHSKRSTTRTLLAGAALLVGFAALKVRADYSNTVGSFNPLGYWRFNETAASPALNVIANSGSLGSIADGYVIMDVDKGETGKVGSAIRIKNPGSGGGLVPGRVDVTYSAGLNPASPFTIEFWTKPNTLGIDATGNAILTSLNPHGFSGGNRQGWVIYLNDAGRINFWLGLNSGYASQLTATSGTLAVGNWYHVVCTYDGLTNRIFVNGVPAGSQGTSEVGTGWKPNNQMILRMGGTALSSTVLNPVPTTAPGVPGVTRPAIAAGGVAGNRGYDGWLDEVAIYNSVLSGSQIVAHYQAATTNNAGYGAQILAGAPLAYWRMEEPVAIAPNPSTFPIAANSGSAGSADGTNMWGTLAAQPGADYAGFGAGNNAVFFDGANGSIGLQDAPGLHFSGNITLMAWVKPKDRDYYRNIIANGLHDERGETFLRISRSDDSNGGGTTTNYYEIGVCNGVPFGNNLIFPGGTANYYHAAIFPIPEGDFGNWVFLAGTYDGASWNLYRNGALVRSFASTHGALDITNRWAIGSRADPSPANPTADPRFFAAHGLRFGGHIDEPAIFNTALSAADIASIYNSAQVPPGITRAVQSPGNVFKGDPASFSVWAEGSPTLSYLWLSNGISTGVTTTNFNISVLKDGTQTIAAAVSNPYGAVTSSVTFLVVAAPPAFTRQPVPVARYAGRPFSFSVTVSGTSPISYQWNTNGVPIPAANSSSYTGIVSAVTVGNYSCTVSNETGVVTNSATVALTVITPPTGYGGVVIADTPIAYWRLGEASGTTTAFDYYGGHNGTYFKAALGQSGFSALDSDNAAAFNGENSYVGSISGDPATGGINFQGHVNFTLEAWVNGSSGMANESSIIAKGAGNSGTSATEQFALDVNANPSAGGNATFRFFTRGGGDSLFQAYADVGPDGTWQHVVGVYDDLNVLGLGTNLHIFVNGELRGSAPTRLAGLRASTVPVSIASKHLGNDPDYDGTFNGTVDEVAVYSYALTALQISNHYATAYGTTTKPNITRQPVSQTAYENSPVPVKFDVGAFGTQPLTYQWKKGGIDLSDDGQHIFGAQTRTLKIGPDPGLPGQPVSPGDAGDYSVTINNIVGPPTNSTVVTLTIVPAPTNAVLVPGLVLHLPLDGNLNDTSGRGNSGTGMRTTLNTTNTATPAANAGINPDFYYESAGKLGQALHYHTATDNGGNGPVTNAYFVTLGNKPDLRFGSNVNFSISYWARYPDVASFPELGDLPFIATAVNSYGNAGLTIAPSYQLGSWSYSLNGVSQVYGLDHLLSDGLWHHVAHSFDRAGAGTTYVDGQQVDVRAITTAGNLDNGNAMNIGQDPTGRYPEEGAYDIDDIGIWRRALSSFEVVGIYLAATLANSSFFDIAPTIARGPGPNQVTVTWQAGTLQSAANVAGPYSDVSGATSPYTVTATGTTFYRTRY